MRLADHGRPEPHHGCTHQFFQGSGPYPWPRPLLEMRTSLAWDRHSSADARKTTVPVSPLLPQCIEQLDAFVEDVMVPIISGGSVFQHRIGYVLISDVLVG